MKEKNLDNYKEIYDNFFHNSMTGFALHRVIRNKKGFPIDFTFLEINTVFKKIFKLQNQEIINKNASLLIPEATENSNLLKILHASLSQNKPDNFEIYISTIKQNTDIFIFPINKEKFITMFMPLEKKKMLEEKIRKNETRFRELFNNMNSGVAVYETKNNGEDFIFKDFNKAGERIEKIEKEKLIGKSVLKTFPMIKKMGLFEIFKKVWQTGKAERLQRALYTDNRISGWRDNYVYKLPSGELVAVYEDITEQILAREKLEESNKKLHHSMKSIIDSMVKISEIRDPYTAGHERRVVKLAVIIAKKMGLSKEQIDCIETASILHDIGKIYVPAEILSKPGQITKAERNLIETHCQMGHYILESIDFPWPVADIVLQHHERLDGSGYPNKYKTNKILFEAKLIAVADVVEAMSSHRPYRPALPMQTALNEIEEKKEKLYDPDVVNACLKVIREDNFTF